MRGHGAKPEGGAKRPFPPALTGGESPPLAQRFDNGQKAKVDWLILGAVAQLERSMIRERSIAGQNAARLRGRMPGRDRGMSPEDEAALVAEYLQGDTTYRVVAERYAVSLSVAKRAVYRVTKPPEYLKRVKA